MTEMMRRWEMDGIGRDRLELREVPVPKPGPGEVLVNVAAVALNYRDKMVTESGRGLPLAFPFTPGSDLAGTVAALGEDVTRFGVGDHVISTITPDWVEGSRPGDARTPFYRTLGGFYPGVLADYVALPQDWFVRAPATLDFAEAKAHPRLARATPAMDPAPAAAVPLVGTRFFLPPPAPGSFIVEAWADDYIHYKPRPEWQSLLGAVPSVTRSTFGVRTSSRQPRRCYTRRTAAVNLGTWISRTSCCTTSARLCRLAATGFASNMGLLCRRRQIVSCTKWATATLSHRDRPPSPIGKKRGHLRRSIGPT
jgi:hypothetical protein